MKDFARFDDVENALTRAYNRLVVAHNVAREFGPEKVKEYLDGFDDRSKLEIAVIVGMIKKNGLKKVQEEVVNECL